MAIGSEGSSELARTMAVGGTVFGNVLAWAQSIAIGRIDFAAYSTGITGIGLALAGALYTVNVSRAKAKREADRLALESEIAARAARLDIEAQAAAAKLKIEAAAERARIEMAVERDAKLAPLLRTQLSEVNRRLSDAEQAREDMRFLLDSIRASQVEIRDKIAVKPRVLVVDDDEDSRSVICRTLSSKGYDCETVGTIAEARRSISPRVSWLILDHVMPDGSGLDFLREVRSQNLPCKVAFVTGHDSESTLAAADAAMADVVAPKPIDLDSLVSRMRSLAGKSPRPHKSDVDIAMIRSDSGIIPIPKP